ncbi:MAG: 6-phosphogluconolactonase [Actinomycetota bacterium]|nr:6-phosphogluconolactonase [Actinomycetota bacterium]
MTTRSIVVHPDADLLAQAAAARLLTAVLDAQAARGSAGVVLTGGGVGIATLEALADLPGHRAIDWSALDLWWGDERFLPAGHADRNETQARQALLDRVPAFPERVHPVPAARRSGPHGPDRSRTVEDAGTAALFYAGELAAAARAENPTGNPAGSSTPDGARQQVPTFDVVLLGLGPDGHVASLFAGHPALREEVATTVAVHDSPKPPPVRVSLTLSALNSGREVWLLAAGRAKADAVARALAPVPGGQGPPPDEKGSGPCGMPAGLVRGRSATRWLLDEAAASRLGR